MLAEGKYLGRIVGYGFTEKGQVYVTFDLKDKEDVVTWYGSFTGGARQYTVDNLLTLGYGGKDGTDIALGAGSSVLDETRDFEVVVRHETYEGKTRAKVKFINVPGGIKDALSAQDAKVQIGGLNLAGDFAEARQKNPPPKLKNYADDIKASDEVPF